MATATLRSENFTLQQKVDKIDSEIMAKAQAARNARPKMMTHSMFQPRSKSNIKVESNLFRQKAFDPEPILREQAKECTFKPAINDSSMVRNYVPVIDRTFPKKEIVLNKDIEPREYAELVRQQGDKGRECLPNEEWEKREKVVLSEQASAKSEEENEVAKERRNYNPNFYQEQFAWLKGIHKKIREEQLNIDQEPKVEGEDVLAKTRTVNQELLKTNHDFFERLEEERKARKERKEELSKETYNFSFKPVINPKSREIYQALDPDARPMSHHHGPVFVASRSQDKHVPATPNDTLKLKTAAATQVISSATEPLKNEVKAGPKSEVAQSAKEVSKDGTKEPPKSPVPLHFKEKERLTFGKK